MNNDEQGKLSYEEAFEKLEALVRRLEDENVPLEESLSLFQEGIALSKYCREKLAQIEYRVEYLLKEEAEISQGDDNSGAEPEDEQE